MKTLTDMKIKFFRLFTIVLLLPSFTSALLGTSGGAGGGLYAQDPELFEHTWYFVNGEIGGEIFYPLSYLNGELNFYSELISIYHAYCEDAMDAGIQFEGSSPFFSLYDDGVILPGICGEPDEFEFMSKHYGIYINNGQYNNPFTYSIETVNSYYQLTIENGEGDWAVYNSVLLSTPGFNKSSFYIYPIPVKETLHINNTSNQAVTATIYDISGKLLQSHILIANTSTIDLKALQTGLYFVVFESESGERVSKKFVKK